MQCQTEPTRLDATAMTDSDGVALEGGNASQRMILGRSRDRCIYFASGSVCDTRCAPTWSDMSWEMTSVLMPRDTTTLLSLGTMGSRLDSTSTMSTLGPNLWIPKPRQNTADEDE